MPIPDAAKLMIGAGGIYAAFMYYGVMQEAVYQYKAEDGSKFTANWFLQAIEAFANVAVAALGMAVTGGTAGLPMMPFAMSGFTQVTAKYFTSAALASGLSFPVATLAKSGKMIPVMAGGLLLGGDKYSLRQYTQVLMIVLGTAAVSMSGKSKPGESSSLGMIYIALSLACDGFTGGMQKRLKNSIATQGLKAQPYDMMLYTNLFMAVVAAVWAVAVGEITSGVAYCTANPAIMTKIGAFAICSAIGQSFIFYTISNFDPLVTTTVTTTRKVFSVLLSIFLNGHQLSPTGWGGILFASAGIVGECLPKSAPKKRAN